MTLNNINTTSNRDLALDLLRAFGIFCMIIGHIGFGSKIDLFIHAFHMPLFFFVSGMFFKDVDINFNTFAKNKARKLLLPYLYFGTFYYIVVLIFFTSDWYGPLKILLWNNFNGMYFVGALWFLTAFFTANIIYFAINSIKSFVLRLIAVVSVVSLGTLLPLLLPFRLPYTMDAGMVGVGFMFCGHLLKKSRYYEKWTNLPFYYIFRISVLILILIFINGYVNMKLGIYRNVLLFWVNALGSIFIGINLCNLVVRTTKSLHCMKLLSWISIMGRDSLVFLCVNEFIILILIHSIQLDNLIVLIFIYLILTILGCYLVNYLIKKAKAIFYLK